MPIQMFFESDDNGVILLVDGRQGLTPQDRIIADQLRKTGRKYWLVVNKAEGMRPEAVAAEFHELGLGDPLVISAAQDKVAPPAYARKFADALPHAKFASLAGAGHYAHDEKPAEAAGLVRDFFGFGGGG